MSNFLCNRCGKKYGEEGFFTDAELNPCYYLRLPEITIFCGPACVGEHLREEKDEIKDS